MVIVYISITIILMVLYGSKFAVSRIYSKKYINYLFIKESFVLQKKYIIGFLLTCLLLPLVTIATYSFFPDLVQKHKIVYHWKDYGSLELIIISIIRALVYWIAAVIYGLEVMFNYISKYSSLLAMVIATLLISEFSIQPVNLVGLILTLVLDVSPVFIMILIYNSSRNMIVIIPLIFIKWIFFSSLLMYLHFMMR